MIRKPEEMRTEQRTEARGGTGTFSQRFVLDGPEELNGKGRFFAHMTFPPGASIGTHTHQGEWELFYILKGTGEYQEEGVIYPFGPGYMMKLPAGGTHSIKNTGTEPMEMVALALNAD